LTLIDPDPQIRRQARDYIAEVIERAAARGATAIIGSMQGRVGTRDRAECLSLLGEQLTDLAQVAAACGKSLFYEPLNRYETDLFNDLDSTAAFLANGLPSNLQILADLHLSNTISWKKDKTNATYLIEFAKNQDDTQFRRVIYLYEFSWFGKVKLNKEQFNDYRKLFDEFRAFTSTLKKSTKA
jgi:hypothetical protein